MDGAGDIIVVALYGALLGCWFGYSRGWRDATERDAKFTQIGRWLADAIAGVHSNHKFHGSGVTTTSKSRAKLGNGETYIVTVEMERP